MIPEDALEILGQPVILIERQVDDANFWLGWNSARRMKVFSPDGYQVGYIQEETSGAATMAARQFLPDHRSYKFTLFNSNGQPVLTIRRPAKAINSTIKCYIPDGALVGKMSQHWHLWRRKYTLRCTETTKSDIPCESDFGEINSKALSYNLKVTKPGTKEEIGAIKRQWVGVATEWYTTGGLYAVEFGKLSLNQRATLIGAALSIDTDFFSDGTGAQEFQFFKRGH